MPQSVDIVTHFASEHRAVARIVAADTDDFQFGERP